MPPRDAYILEEGGERFRFYFDLDVPEELHITVQHDTTTDDAMWTFFDGESTWNEQHLRWETATDSHVLYWTRHAFDGSVVVISCFLKRGE